MDSTTQQLFQIGFLVHLPAYKLITVQVSSKVLDFNCTTILARVCTFTHTYIRTYITTAQICISMIVSRSPIISVILFNQYNTDDYSAEYQYLLIFCPGLGNTSVAFMRYLHLRL